MTQSPLKLGNYGTIGLYRDTEGYMGLCRNITGHRWVNRVLNECVRKL